jgi:hypothetical protein
MPVYVAKEGTWFDKGTEARLLESLGNNSPCGLFRGRRSGKTDEEVCRFDDFEIKDAEE